LKNIIKTFSIFSLIIFSFSCGPKSNELLEAAVKKISCVQQCVDEGNSLCICENTCFRYGINCDSATKEQAIKTTKVNFFVSTLLDSYTPYVSLAIGSDGERWEKKHAQNLISMLNPLFNGYAKFEVGSFENIDSKICLAEHEDGNNCPSQDKMSTWDAIVGEYDTLSAIKAYHSKADGINVLIANTLYYEEEVLALGGTGYAGGCTETNVNLIDKPTIVIVAHSGPTTLAHEIFHTMGAEHVRDYSGAYMYDSSSIEWYKKCNLEVFYTRYYDDPGGTNSVPLPDQDNVMAYGADWTKIDFFTPHYGKAFCNMMLCWNDENYHVGTLNIFPIDCPLW